MIQRRLLRLAEIIEHRASSPQGRGVVLAKAKAIERCRLKVLLQSGNRRLQAKCPRWPAGEHQCGPGHPLRGSAPREDIVRVEVGILSNETLRRSNSRQLISQL